MNGAPVRPDDALKAWNKLSDDPRLFHIDVEPADHEPRFVSLVSSREPTPNLWTDAWLAPGAPEPLPMPLQNLLVSEAHQRLMRSGDPDVIPMPVGQIVGRTNEVRPVAELIG